MSSIEKVVRPFQTTDVFRARRLPPSQLAIIGTPADIVVSWEGRADSQFSEEEPALQLNFKVTWEEDKSRRQSKLMKVVNPDDTTQKVFMERVDQYTFVDNITKKEQTFKFDWTSSLDNATQV